MERLPSASRGHRSRVLRRGSLPDDLLARPFTVAEALARGVDPKALRHPSLRRPTSGVRVPGHLDDDVAVRCAAIAMVLPSSAAFSHTTAAELSGLPLWPPRRHRSVPLPAGVVPTVMVPTGSSVPRRRGVRSREGLHLPSVRRVRGVRVVSTEATWCDLAPHLDDVDAIVLGDAVITLGHGPSTLLEELDRRAGRRGIVRLRELVLRLRWPVRSPMETVWRLDVARAGIPEPVLNAPVFDGVGGWLGAPDQQWPEVKVASEYDGDGHRTDRRQWREDIARQALMEDEGWWVQRVTAADVGRRSGPAVDRLWRALHRRGLPGLPPRP